MTDPTQLASETFDIGEQVLYTRWDGVVLDVTIVRRWVGDRNIKRLGVSQHCDGYLVTGPGITGNQLWPNMAAAQTYELRKKRPPRKDLEVVRWDQCPWQPEVLRV